MKYLVITILTLFHFDAFGQRKLGIGFVKVNFDENSILEFYASPESPEPIKILEFFLDETINSISIKNFDEQTWLKPASIWLDYYDFRLRAVEQSNDWLRVVVNESNWTTYWIRSDELTPLLTWEEFLKELFNVERIIPSDQPIQRAPKDNSPTINYSGVDCFNVRQVKGDWIEIYSPSWCEDFNNWKTKLTSGWIKWKRGNTLLIQLYITP